jgi:hypothetical protein
MSIENIAAELMERSKTSNLSDIEQLLIKQDFDHIKRGMEDIAYYLNKIKSILGAREEI